MKFSVITPSFQNREFLPGAIASVAAQTYHRCEHIVIDGGSTDGTVEVLRATPGLQWISEPDQGQSEAINKGFRMATGDIICWLNADERLFPRAIETVQRFFEANSEKEVAFGDAIFVDSSGHFLRRKEEPEFNFNMLLFMGCYISSAATFFRKSVLDTAGFLREDLKTVMDTEYYLRLARSGARFGKIHEALALFTVRSNSVSGLHTDTKDREKRAVQREYSQFLPRNPKACALGLQTLFCVYKAKHIAWKLTRGAYARERVPPAMFAASSN